MQTLDAVLSPIGRAEFLSEHWNKSFLRVPGTPGRFRSLLSWEDLNRILEQHRLEPPRLTLAQNGKVLDVKRYLLPGPSGSRINAGGLTACLSNGATLVLDEVEEMVPAVRNLAASCEDALQARVTVNLYAGFRTQKGFNLHWDPQDTMILQVAGRKHWKVYRPTRLHPVDSDLRKAPQPTDADICWDGVLDDGDLLYLPRGWWHVAAPLDEPSLHLTVTVVPPHGTDFLHWLVDQACDEAIRRDVPRLDDEVAQKAFVDDVSRAMAAAVSPEALGRFLESWDSDRRARPRMGLPDVSSAQTELRAETRLRLGQAHRIAVTRLEEGDIVQLHANGETWTGAAVLVPALRRLSAAESVTVDELCGAVPADAARSLKAMLTTLVMIGVVVVEPQV